MRETPLTWSLVVPVKVLAYAKSRLSDLSESDRADLALAMAADTVAAATGCDAVATVVVVTNDTVVRTELAGLGAIVIADEPDSGLNAALRHGAGHSERRRPGLGMAALAADLPALTTADLDAALAAAANYPQCYVADAAGIGTTFYAAGPGQPFRPRFGELSSQRHKAAGAIELTLAEASGLRRDVDTIADLRAAARIGLGPRSAAVAVNLRLATAC